jgi:hypothetical protein
MPALLELQQAMRVATLTGDASRAAAAIRADGIAAEARLQIHRHHFFTTLTEALAANFPVVCRLVDRRFFDYLAHHFIAANPPREPCLFEYGAHFPDFIAGFPACRNLPYLPDVARLEFAMNAVLHAPDLPVLTAEMLGDVALESFGALRFVLHPAARVVSSRYPVDRIWRTNQVDDGTVVLGGDGARLLMQRCHDEVTWRVLSAAEFMFVRGLAAGQTLELALELAGPVDLTSFFAELLVGGAFAGFVNPNPRRMS